MSVFVIAEIGVNHNGNPALAMDMIDAAKQAGADAVKFQLFKDRPEIEDLRISEEDMIRLHYHCQEVGIEFMCTPFYLEAVAFLNPLVFRHKIASGWTYDKSIYEAAIATGKPVIASLGGLSLADYIKLEKQRNVCWLHCVSLYPCPDNKAALRKDYGFWLDGYSDHTIGTLACLGAVARGAKIIEKHFTFDKTQSGPDHSCSAEPDEFAQMVKDIRRLEKML